MCACYVALKCHSSAGWHFKVKFSWTTVYSDVASFGQTQQEKMNWIPFIKGAVAFLRNKSWANLYVEWCLLELSDNIADFYHWLNIRSSSWLRKKTPKLHKSIQGDEKFLCQPWRIVEVQCFGKQWEHLKKNNPTVGYSKTPCSSHPPCYT